MSIASITEKVIKTTAKWKTKRNEGKRIEAMREAARRVQVREFDNMLCLSLDGIPLVPLREFDKQALSDARLTFYNYLKSRM